MLYVMYISVCVPDSILYFTSNPIQFHILASSITYCGVILQVEPYF